MSDTEVVRATNWWSQSSWFDGGQADTSLCVSTGEEERCELPLDGATPPTKAGKVGGAAAQNRFNGATNLPIGTTPAGDCNLIQTPEPFPGSRLVAIGGAKTHSRFNDRKKPTGACCDGTTPGLYRPGVPLFSKWAFDLNTWTWRQSKDGAALCTGPELGENHSAIAGRRWGDGRDSLGAAVAAAAAAAAAPKAPRARGAKVKDAGEQVPGGFGAVAGMSRAKALLRESVVLPLRHPRAFKSLGLPSCRCVMLHGPPGSGKTYLAMALAQEARVHLEVLPASEIVAGDKASARLQQAVDAAREKAPAILLVEQVDVCSPCPGEARGEAARMASARLIAAIDALRADGAQVCVVATTNRRQAVNPAICRAGRLELEIALGALDAGDRLEVVQDSVKRMPLAADVKLQDVSDRMAGYVAADVAGACQQAAINAISEAFTALQQGAAVTDGSGTTAMDWSADGDVSAQEEEQLCKQVVVAARHFDAALESMGPSLLRGLAPEVPRVDWESVGGLQEAKQALQDLVEMPIKHSDLIRRFGLPSARGALLYGPPGCGKTLLAKVVAAKCGANFLCVNGPQLLDKWLGGSEANVRAVFEAARASHPCVIFFDELDALAPRRGGGLAGGDAAAARVLNQLLVELDGVSPCGDVFVVGATNRPETLDPALTRPGRLDHLIKVPLPDEAGRESALRAIFRRTPLHPSIDLPQLAASTEGCSGADLACLARDAVKMAVTEGLAAEELHWQQQQQMQGAEQSASAAAAPSCLLPRHVEAALDRCRRSVSSEEAARFDEMEAALRDGGGLDRFVAAAGQQEDKQEQLQGLLRDVSERVAASKAAQLDAQLQEAQAQLQERDEKLQQQEAQLRAMMQALRAAGLPVPAGGLQ